jgi:alkaline phosphatase D
MTTFRRRWLATLLQVACTIALLSKQVIAAEPSSERPVSRILFGSCIKQDQPMPTLGTMLAHHPHLLIMLGDNIYADTQDMELMRAKYARLGANEQFQRLRAVCPVLATWDDHDYGVNDGGAEFPQRDAAQQVFLEFWQDPIDSPRRTRPGVYDSHVYGPAGQRLQVILLDTRYFRSPLQRGERREAGPYVPDDDPTKTMLGEAQWQWLEAQLRQPAEVRLIASSIQCAAEAVGQETWANLPRERERLFDLIGKTDANGVVLISGDRHWAELSAVREVVPYPLYDLTSSSLNQIHPRGTPSPNQNRALDQTYHQENFGVIDIDWAQADPILSLEIHALDDSVKLQKQLRLSELQPPSNRIE